MNKVTRGSPIAARRASFLQRGGRVLRFSFRASICRAEDCIERRGLAQAVTFYEAKNVDYSRARKPSSLEFLN